MVSQSGRWGIYVENDGIAVVAGPEKFITSLYRTLPSTKEQAIRYASDLLSEPNAIAWSSSLKEFLTDILGPEEATSVLSSAESA